MNLNSLIFGLIMGLFMTFTLNWIYFFDWLGLLGKLLHIIAPSKKDKEIEENQQRRKGERYKNHQRKWKAIFLLAPATFSTVFLIASFIARSPLAAYFCGLIVTVIEYGVLSTMEEKRRNEL